MTAKSGVSGDLQVDVDLTEFEIELTDREIETANGELDSSKRATELRRLRSKRAELDGALVRARQSRDQILGELDTLETEAVELGSRDAEKPLQGAEKSRLLKLKGEIRKLGGPIAVEAVETLSEGIALGENRPDGPNQFLFDGRIEVTNNNGPTIVDQGCRQICGYNCCRAVLKTTRGRDPGQGALEKIVPIRRGAGNQEVGLSGGQISEILSTGGQSWSAQTVGGNAGERFGQVKRMLARSKAPVIVGLRPSPEGLQGLNDAVNTRGYGDGISPSTRRLAQGVSDRLGTNHWVVVDGVVNVSRTGDISNSNLGEPHVLVRDPAGGKTYMVPVETFQREFDGNAISRDS
jgi:hypothetical protein